MTNRARTGDIQNHNLALYQLSYSHHASAPNCIGGDDCCKLVVCAFVPRNFCFQARFRSFRLQSGVFFVQGADFGVQAFEFLKVVSSELFQRFFPIDVFDDSQLN